MENLIPIEDLLAEARKNKKSLEALIKAATHMQCYDLLSKLKIMKNELFPLTDEQKEAKEEGNKLNLVFRMIGLEIPADTCWILYHASRAYTRKRGKFSLKDAAELQTNRKRLFETE